MSLNRTHASDAGQVSYASAFAGTFLRLTKPSEMVAVVYNEPVRLPPAVLEGIALRPEYGASQLAFYIGRLRKNGMSGVEVTFALGTIIDVIEKKGNYALQRSIHVDIMLNHGNPNLGFLRSLTDSVSPAPMHEELSLMRYGAALTNQEDTKGRCTVVPFIRDSDLVSAVRVVVRDLFIEQPDIRIVESIFLH